MKSPIKAIREKSRISRSELARKSGTPYTSLWFIENGRKADINRTLLVYLFKEGYDVGQVVKDYDDYLKELKTIS